MISSDDAIVPILLYIAAIVSLLIGLLFASHFIGPRTRATAATNLPYESGILSVGSARLKFQNHYFLYAIFFVIFDLEAVFLFAWAIAFDEAGVLGFIEAAIFIFILLAALVYVWRIGALELIHRHKSEGG